jgi:hypothetical protein
MKNVLLLIFFGMSLAGYADDEKSITLSEPLTEATFVAADKVSIRSSSTDDIFAAGGELEVSASTRANLYLAGGTAHLEGAKAVTAIVAGGDLDFEGIVVRDLIAAGGQIKLDRSTVSDDWVVAGGSVKVDESSRVNGTARVAAGEVELDGRFGRDVSIAGGKVELEGTFDGNVSVYAERLVLADGARIKGNLSYAADDFEKEDGARIDGKTERVAGFDDDEFSFEWPSLLAAVFGGTLWIIGMTLLNPILIELFPTVASKGRKALKEMPLASLGTGVLAAVAAPAVVVLLLISVAGIPFALAAVPFVAIAWILGWAAMTFFVASYLHDWWLGRSKQPKGKKGKKGAKALEDLKSRGDRLKWTALGSICVGIALSLPFFGSALGVLGGAMGFGAILRVTWSSRGKL